MCARRTARLLVLPLLVLCWVTFGTLLSSATAVAATQDETTKPDWRDRAQARYYAERLRESPVYVSDQAPRAMPRSSAADFRAQAKRAGVPTYVLVLPNEVTALDRYLLQAVQTELGKDGLYVLLDADGGYGGLSVLSAGVDVPAQEAASSARSWVPRDATALDQFRYFVDGLLNDGDASGGGDKPSAFYTTHDDRWTHSVVTGICAVLFPGLVLVVGLPVARQQGWPRRAGWATVGGALALAVLIPLGANAMVTETRASGAPDPTERDLRLRADRVAAGLREAPVYVDAELPPPLTPAHQRELTRKVRALDVPMYLVIMPSLHDDESDGDNDAFLERVRTSYGQDGLYALVDAESYSLGFVRLANHGARLAAEPLRDMPEEVRYGADDDTDRDDRTEREKRFHARMTALVEHVAGTPAGPPGRPEPAGAVSDPVAENTLAPLLSRPFWNAVWGTGLSGLVVALVSGLVWWRRHRSGAGGSARLKALASEGGTSPYADTPEQPSGRWLRTAVGRELDALNEELPTFQGGERARVRAWECLDAALLSLSQRGTWQLDKELTEADLATALALVRAGQTALDAAGQPRRRRRGGSQLCHLNPLHGRAPHLLDLSSPGTGRQVRAVCADCARVVLTGKASGKGASPAQSRTLRLPRPDGGRERVSYQRLPGALGTLAADGDVTVDALVSQVKEQLGVHS